MKTIIKTLFPIFIVFFIAFSAKAVNGMDDVRTIHVKGTDNMKFDVSLIEAKPGEQIKIIFETVSNMPKESMAHNLAIIDLDVDLDAFAMASMMARDNMYIAPEFESGIIARTEMIGGGETSSIEFTVPETPGDYDYVCTFPGHYLSGMVGILRVQ
ncbi:MAG: plastocyanin/azurin family copper-binding protein [Balneolales bacterium]